MTAALPPPRVRTSWPARLAAIMWTMAGLLLVIAPALIVITLQRQYLSLRRQFFSAANLAETFDPTELLSLKQYLAEYETWEGVVTGWAAPLLTPLLIAYIGVALSVLIVYLVLSWYTFRGETWARVTATVLGGLSTPLVFALWLFFSGFEWLPITAIRMNWIGLAIVALHIGGIVCAWWPSKRQVSSAS